MSALEATTDINDIDPADDEGASLDDLPSPATPDDVDPGEDGLDVDVQPAAETEPADNDYPGEDYQGSGAVAEEGPPDDDGPDAGGHPASESEREPQEAGSERPQMLTLALDALAPHPDNPRSDLGDLTEMARSIKANGVLVPLLVLPADEDGVHLIVAGHRRHAASKKAGVNEVPVMVRSMTPVEAIEAMLSENIVRDALTVADEVRAIERLMSLDGALTPNKLCRRIGKSQAWVRTRMAVTILPSRWRSAIDTGELTLAAAEAASSAADLGPEHMEAVCERLAGYRWADPGREVGEYRAGLLRHARYEEALAEAGKSGAVVYGSEEAVPQRARRVTDLFREVDVREQHAGEPCHAVVVKPVGWSDGFVRYDVCVDPGRHGAKRVESGKGSTIAADQTRQVDTQSTNEKRKGRLARLAHATDHFAKQRGGPSRAELVEFALRSLVQEAGRDALRFAATMLGNDKTKGVSPEDLLDGVETPAALARVAGAVACGLAEDHMYWASSSDQCIAWLDLLCGSGWSPDCWSAAVIEQRERWLAERQRRAAEAEAEQMSPGDEPVPTSDDGDEPGDESSASGDEVGDHPSAHGDESDVHEDPASRFSQADEVDADALTASDPDDPDPDD